MRIPGRGNRYRVQFNALAPVWQRATFLAVLVASELQTCYPFDVVNEQSMVNKDSSNLGAATMDYGLVDDVFPGTIR